MARDYYEVLGVGRDAGEGEIKKNFRKLARELHPDVNRHDPAAEEKFKEAAEAYEVLNDSERRAIYDRYGHEGLRSGGFEPDFANFANIGDLFNAFFGGGGGFGPFGGGRGGGPVQGGDLAVDIEISLAEAATGVEREVDFDAIALCERCRGNGAEPGTPIDACERCEGHGEIRTVSQVAFGQFVRTVPCDRCGGEGKIPSKPCDECGGRGRQVTHRRLTVSAPAGIADQQRIRMAGQGHAGERGGRAGDLYILVRVIEDQRFERQGDDLIATIELPAPLAALGTAISVPTLEGEESLEVQPGTQPHATVVLRGRGMPHLQRSGRGDLRVVIDVVVPLNLDEEQRELTQKLADSLREENVQRHEGVWKRIKRAIS